MVICISTSAPIHHSTCRSVSDYCLYIQLNLLPSDHLTLKYTTHENGFASLSRGAVYYCANSKLYQSTVLAQTETVHIVSTHRSPHSMRIVISLVSSHVKGLLHLFNKNATCHPLLANGGRGILIHLQWYVTNIVRTTEAPDEVYALYHRPALVRGTSKAFRWGAHAGQIEPNMPRGP